MEDIIEKIEVLRRTILSDKNVNVLDKGLYALELCDIRLLLEDLEELKTDLLHNVMLSDVDDFEDCPSFDNCKNPLKDKHCDEHMEGSMYCFKE